MPGEFHSYHLVFITSFTVKGSLMLDVPVHCFLPELNFLHHLTSTSIFGFVTIIYIFFLKECYHKHLSVHVEATRSCNTQTGSSEFQLFAWCQCPARAGLASSCLFLLIRPSRPAWRKQCCVYNNAVSTAAKLHRRSVRKTTKSTNC
jgi:hypothetical protein